MPATPVLSPPALPDAGKTSLWHSANDSITALALSAWPVQTPLLVLAADPAEADRLETALRFFLPASEQSRLLRFPDREILPYDAFSPHQDLVSERLRSLYRIQQTDTPWILLCTLSTALQKLPPTGWLAGQSFLLAVGDRLDREGLQTRLVQAGYRAVDTVYEHGEFAARGALLDVFPMGSDQPLRIDLDDDRIDSLRRFDPDNQRSLDRIEHLELLPAREYPLDEAARARFRRHWHEQLGADYRHSPIYRDISEGRAAAGAESYLPFFFDDGCEDLLGQLPATTAILLTERSGEAADRFWAELRERFELRQGDMQHPPLPPEQLYSRPADFFARCQQFPLLKRDTRHSPRQPAQTAPALAQARDGQHDRYQRLQQLLTALQNDSQRVLIAADSPGRQALLIEQLQSRGLSARAVEDWPAFLVSDAPLAITVCPLEQGLSLPELGLALLAENALFEHRVPQRRRRQQSSSGHDNPFRDLVELRPGAPVVHDQHGVGRYQGLERLSIDGQWQEFLCLTYADDTKLFVPVADIHRVAPYSGGDPELAPLHKLGSDQWQKARQKALQKARDVAAELLALLAQREAAGSQPIPVPDTSALARFADGFPFETTADQQTAIDAVLADMAASTPMDRLVCGDVGFGKTEVALRAAFAAVHAGRQVLVLAPTTLLAQQHFDTFSDRFADWPVRIELLSRFRSKPEQEAALKALAEGKVDIVIGTHRLLQDDVHCRDLGLLIVDEEHRFGVRHKERIKALRAGVDILTLTATPIPRTLNMAFSGLRELSIIATPPARRLAIRTFLRGSQPALIREAILREVLRGGQVYYLHNDVASIERRSEELARLVPEASFGIGHGQMGERALEQVMADFYHRRFQVLVCSTIIETGIDVPNANTILIDRADKLGLAQLHQLRGRVGRSHHQAYAYLLVPELRLLKGDAEKRLNAIAEAEDLGAGFVLATQDMEIRGAGELLGEEQSGQIHSVGLTLYLDLVKRAVKAIRSGEDLSLESTLEAGPEFGFPYPALIPDDYIPDIQTRLQLYRRIAETGQNGKTEALQVEMIDRFGLLPDSVRPLFSIARIKARCETLGIRKLDVSRHGIRCSFHSQTPVNPMTLIDLIQKDPRQWQLVDGQQLLWKTVPTDAHQALQACEALLDRLTPA